VTLSDGAADLAGVVPVVVSWLGLPRRRVTRHGREFRFVLDRAVSGTAPSTRQLPAL